MDQEGLGLLSADDVGRSYSGSPVELKIDFQEQYLDRNMDKEQGKKELAFTKENFKEPMDRYYNNPQSLREGLHA